MKYFLTRGFWSQSAIIRGVKPTGAVQQNLIEPIKPVARSPVKEFTPSLHLGRRMSGYMSGSTSGRIRLPQWVVPLAVLAFFLGMAGAFAQTVGPDEAVNADGAVSQKLVLTEAQKNAIYNAVLQQRVRSSAGIAIAIPVAVGAPVSAAAELAELPGQAAADDPLAMDLKYAMVEGDVVVVDPIRMRVVEIIHGNARP